MSAGTMNVIADLIAAWPPERPLAVIWEGGEAGRSIVAEPGEVFRAWPGRSEWTDAWGGAAPAPLEFTHEPVEDASALAQRFERAGTGWISCFSYDLGRVIEPSVERSPLARPRARADRRWPLIEMQRLVRGVMIEHASGVLTPLGGFAPGGGAGSPGQFRVGALRQGMSRGEYEAAAARTVEYVRAGDIFQANIAHRLSADFEGSARAAFIALARRAAPWHGAYMEAPGRAVLSVSPELFLDVDLGARRIMSRPMKGTRSGAVDPRELDESAKDRAELNMIIDLMRNDLGRIARLGGVHVTESRRIERHAGVRGVLQATARVEAALRDGVGWAEILRATFPPGSVTGAPKIRAMQIIDELEPVHRGPYCGAIGFMADSGVSRLNVGIRTALITGETASPGVFERGVLDYSVGAGIVAESEPAAEWEETITKASVLDALHAS